MKQRRKSKPCLLCGHSTRDWDYICNACRADRETGRAFRKSGLQEGQAETLIAWHWELYAHCGIAAREDCAKKAIQESLLRLVDAVQLPGRHDLKSKIGIGLHDKPGRWNTNVARYVIRGKDSPELLQAIYESICDLMAAAYDDGLGRGRSFVTDIATGDIKIKDLENL